MRTNGIAASFFCTILAASSALAQTVGIGSSNPGSITHSISSALAKVMVEKLGLQARVQPHSGQSSFVPAVNAGEEDFGVANAGEFHDGITGTGIYTGQKLSNLRAVAVLMPIKVAFFVPKNSPIKTMQDLKGKRFPGGWTSQKTVDLTVRGLLANANMSYADVKVVPVPNVVRGADDFIQGKVDTFYFALGAGKVREAASKVGGLRALAADPSPEAVARIRKDQPVAYVMLAKPSPANFGIDGPTHVVAFDFVLLTNAKQSEDRIYELTKALRGAKKSFIASFKPLGFNFDPNGMAKVLPGGEYHPGAIKYFKEIGAWPPKN
ncbi:MAG: hypothetical protein A3H32_11740 [Betaproteobacteria bacterium RIFCSPLOWO2_02_FULL_63_19]|nr:MAG: hypothetical protein A3H32_11740 [Betaproteobacteria bacterium RIFCSPLOWO2_02_FULL_63_19]